MTSTSKVTTDHQEIKQWVEKVGGKPTIVKSSGKNNSGILRIDFPGYTGEDTLEEISWYEFFKEFDKKNLQFLYQEETADGRESRFNKFIAGD
jgi:hypothetical protein